MVGSPGIPAAVRERPPRKGPIERYFIPLKSGSPSFLSSLSLSSFADESEAGGAFFCAASTLGFPSFCWEKVSVTENRTSKASVATRARGLRTWIMNSMAPEKEFGMANVNARGAKVTNGGLGSWSQFASKKILTTGGTGVHRVPQRSSTTDIPCASVRPDIGKFRLRTRIVNTMNNETLVDFCRCRLECFKHFYDFLFETECVEKC